MVGTRAGSVPERPRRKGLRPSTWNMKRARCRPTVPIYSGCGIPVSAQREVPEQIASGVFRLMEGGGEAKRLGAARCVRARSRQSRRARRICIFGWSQQAGMFWRDLRRSTSSSPSSALTSMCVAFQGEPPDRSPVYSSS